MDHFKVKVWQKKLVNLKIHKLAKWLGAQFVSFVLVLESSSWWEEAAIAKGLAEYTAKLCSWLLAQGRHSTFL